MVKKIKIGVVGIQGAIKEHVTLLEKTFKNNKINGKIKIIKDKNQLNEVDGLIIPGGESSTISKIIFNSGLNIEIKNKIEERNFPIMGTCAGCVILASEFSDENNNVNLLQLIDIQVKRNSFGRQRESFEKNIKIKGFEKLYNAVFIRAPIITKMWGNCKILARVEQNIVMAKQDNLIALSFHPELTNDLRIHKYFLDLF
jgi:5'-phosphate synthase pdxT subunit